MNLTMSFLYAAYFYEGWVDDHEDLEELVCLKQYFSVVVVVVVVIYCQGTP